MLTLIRRLATLGLAAGLVAAPRPAAALLTGLPTGFVDELVVGGLPFPTAVAFAPGGRMLVALKSGEVRMYQGAPPTLVGTFIDINTIVHDNHDRGLLGLAVHPDFPNTPYVYLLYTHDPAGVYPDDVQPGASPSSVSARVSQLMRVEADPATGYATAKAGTEVVLLGTNSTRANIGSENDGRNTAIASCMSPKTPSGTPVEDCIASDEDSHTIGTLVFAPDGSLFVSSGDGSNYVNVDPRALRAQNLDSLQGKILRIDPITGLGLPDNPFYDAANPNRNRSKVWAYGLRNPFRISVNPQTSQPFIGDVGWNSWEEIDTGKGANFGWPCYEGGAASGSESGVTTSLRQGAYETNGSTRPTCLALYNQGLGAVKAPTFAYDHSAGGASANGGAFYTGSSYPAAYQGALFIADYNRRWVRYLTFDAQGNATVHPFGTENTSGTGPVQLAIGPDSNLYWMKYVSSGGELRRVRYTGAGNTPPVVIATATPTIGFAPLAVVFDSNASYDPDAQPLSALWDFGDGTTSTERSPSHVYANPGIYDAVLTLTEQTAPFASNNLTIRITAGNNPPLASIEAPANGASYRVGDVIAFSGTATSGPDPIPATQLTWELRTLHNQHVHYDALPSAPDPTDAFRSVGSFTVEDHGDDVRFQLCLTATILPEGFTDTQCVDLFPEKTEITLATDPIGLLISYDDEGLTLVGPALIHPVVNAVQTISVLPVQQHRSFVQWDDATTSTDRTFTVGTTPQTYTAYYANLAPTAVVAPAGITGVAPLTVLFQGTSSSDPEADALAYAWDAGSAGTSTESSPSFTFPTPGTYTVTLTVTDQLGSTGSTQVEVSVNNGLPIPTITSPASGSTWNASGAFAFAGEGFDPNSGPLPPEALAWEFYLHVCDAQGQNCQPQLVGTADAVAGGSLQIPAVFAAGSSPGMLEVRLTATTVPPQNWLDLAWPHRRELAIDNTAQAETLVDFPVLVRLDPTRIDYAGAQPQGQDLRFTDANGQLLDHEIESWSPGGTSLVWVKVPSIPAASGAASIFMYYGNPAATDAQDPAGVWSGYAGVWHMGPSLADSTGNGNVGTDFGTSADAGYLGDARRFDGASWIDAGNGPSLALAGQLSLEAWVAIDDPDLAGSPRILSKKPTGPRPRASTSSTSPSENNLTSLGSGQDFVRAENVDLDTAWHWVGSSLNGATGQRIRGRRRPHDGRDARPGRRPPDAVAALRPRAGRVLPRADRRDPRSPRSARSAAWFAAQYLSMTDAFLSYGPVETPTPGSATAVLLLAPETAALTSARCRPGSGSRSAASRSRPRAPSPRSSARREP